MQTCTGSNIAPAAEGFYDNAKILLQEYSSGRMSPHGLRGSPGRRRDDNLRVLNLLRHPAPQRLHPGDIRSDPLSLTHHTRAWYVEKFQKLRKLRARSVLPPGPQRAENALPRAERPRILALVSRAPGCGASRAEQKCTLWLVTGGSKSGRAATLQEQDEKASRVRFILRRDRLELGAAGLVGYSDPRCRVEERVPARRLKFGANEAIAQTGLLDAGRAQKVLRTRDVQIIPRSETPPARICRCPWRC